MKKLMTCMLISMLSVSAMAQLRIWHDGRVLFQCEYELIDSVTFGMPSTPDPQPQLDGDALSPEETKEYLMAVAKKMVNKFNTADQKAVIELADGLYEKYRRYDWGMFEDEYGDRFDEFFRMPRYMKQVVRGDAAPSDLDMTWVFGFKEESAIFEADEQCRCWKYLGHSSDNSVIMRCKDKNGVLCEAKVWGEGETHTYEYSWDMSYWEYPKIYASDRVVFYEYAGYYNGDWHYFYMDESGAWYYYDYTEEMFYVRESDIDIRQKYGSDDHWYYYEEETGRWYYKDWDNGYRVYGTRTVKGVLPDKIYFTLKHGSDEVMRVEFGQEMKKNDHAYFSLFAKLANLSWTTDVKVNSTHGTAAFAFFYGDKQFFSVAANLPMYELIDKQDSQSYEDWIEEYGDRYDELFKKIGEASAIVDLFGEVQIKAKVNNFGYAYRDYMKWDEAENYENRHTKAMVQQFCSIFNDNSENGIYYNSDVKQAELRVKAAYDEIDEWYYPEPVLYFPKDGTSYAYEQYFNRKPFTDLQYMVEDLVNAYIQCSKNLFDEVGTVEF